MLGFGMGRKFRLLDKAVPHEKWSEAEVENSVSWNAWGAFFLLFISAFIRNNAQELIYNDSWWKVWTSAVNGSDQLYSFSESLSGLIIVVGVVAFILLIVGGVKTRGFRRGNVSSQNVVAIGIVLSWITLGLSVVSVFIPLIVFVAFNVVPIVLILLLATIIIRI